MKQLLVIPAAALTLGLSLVATDEDSKDRQAVERAIQDYVDGFYDAKPELIERSVHADLVKFGFWRPGDDHPYSDGSAMTFSQAVDLAKTWNADGRQGELREYEIEVFDVLDKTAAGKVTAQWGSDYFHLAKEDGKWKIRHALWQSHPPSDEKSR